MQGYDACFYCLGVTSFRMREEDYRQVTYDLTLSVALGLGLPQMKEYLIRRDSLKSLVKFLRQRLHFVAASRFEYRTVNVRENLDDR